MLSAEGKALLDEFYADAVAIRGKKYSKRKEKAAIAKLEGSDVVEVRDGSSYPTAEAATYLQKLFVKELIAHIVLDDDLFNEVLGSKDNV